VAKVAIDKKTGQTAKVCPVEDILENLRRLAFCCTSGRVATLVGNQELGLVVDIGGGD
jgi:hypothetical protein